jgi:acetyl-CoA carboxylase biotin carboxylase subunit
MFKKVLVANRGEITVRVLRACRELGVETVAVYSDADRTALHVRYADEAYSIGPALARDSYLRIDKLIEVARQSGAEAIHPGYGFLAENPDLAAACRDAGIIFIGPPAQAIAAMGDKVKARQIMRQAGVPVIPGTKRDLSDGDLLRMAEQIGFPVFVKAAAGGGGKGMRLVTAPSELERSLKSARREALGAFGDDRVYLEKAIQRAHHVEIQVLADTRENAIHLGERECSVQRRHQKLIEEAPSPIVNAELRQRMGEIAIQAAVAAGYVNAGTVEFLVDGERNFYFLEMNTRLQVEHPITESTTGVDIVVEQLRIASGEPLRLAQEDVRHSGWAIECRITAEDPFEDFRPHSGRITSLLEPSGPGIRVDSGIYEGYEVSPYYDSLLSKLITWGENRAEAIRRMRRALQEYRIVGVPTSIPFHRQVMETPDFVEGNYDTSFLDCFSIRAAVDEKGKEAAAITAAMVHHHELEQTSAQPPQALAGAASGMGNGSPTQQPLAAPPIVGEWKMPDLESLPPLHRELVERAETLKKGGPEKYHDRIAKDNKLFVRDRIAYMLDPGSFVEDGLFARYTENLPTDAMIVGMGTIQGRKVAIIANDYTVKAGTWGRLGYKKMTYMQRKADQLGIPLLYLIDSAGARIDDQQHCYAGRDAWGNIFYNQIVFSGRIPQICVLLGPSPAGSAYVPALCDITIMVDKNVTVYMGSPRMAEMAIGEKVTMEEMGGARMHCEVSGLGDMLVGDDHEAMDAALKYLSFFPQNWRENPPRVAARDPMPGRPIEEIVPERESIPFDMHEFIEAFIDEDSWWEYKQLFAPEMITGLARLGGRSVGILANQSIVKGGVIFPDSADKAARFIWICNAFNIPLLFLNDIAGFMIGTQVERQGIIRHGAKFLFAVSEATVPRICVIVRKAYGGGYLAMSGAPINPDAVLALPTAKPALMGPAPAINAIYYNRIMELPPEERPAFIQAKRDEYEDNIDPYAMANEFFFEGIIPAPQLRQELIARFEMYALKEAKGIERRNGIIPG